MKSNNRNDLEVAYERVIDRYHRLNDIVEDLILHKLDENKLKYSGVKSRVKCFDSFLEKCQKKEYEQPLDECTDILGIRVTSYLESDIEKIESIVCDLFSVNEKDSIDKRRPESTREFGYRSLHLICKLGDARSSLPEYSDLHALEFEVQIRTALQDTWAEIEHAFNYKSKAALPAALERKLFGASAVLETVDATLATVTKEANEYFELVASGATGHGSDPLTSVGIEAFVKSYVEKNSIPNIDDNPKYKNWSETAIVELEKFGIENLADLDELMNSIPQRNYLSFINSNNKFNPIQIVRIPMIFSDPKKFFEKIDTSTLPNVGSRVAGLVQEEHPDLDIRDLLEKNGFPAIGDD